MYRETNWCINCVLMRVMDASFTASITLINTVDTPVCLSRRRHSYLQSWPKLCGTSLQNALPRPSISFSHGNKRSLGQILPSIPPPSPHAMLFVRKGLPTSRPALHRGGGGGGGGGKGGASEYCSNSGKRHFVPHILARIVVLLRAGITLLSI